MKKKSTYRITSADGIDEKIYVDINGQKQYVFLRGENKHNPVILYLHGGPASPDAYFTYNFAKDICKDFTFVCWDQRGCGRTYVKNRKNDPENKTVSFEQAIKDVDALVSYLCERFQKKKIIIMGHSYGTIPGVTYASEYPEKVESYIGIGQHVSNIDALERNYKEIYQRISADDNKRKKLEGAYQKLKDDYNAENFMRFQQVSMPLLYADVPKLNQTSEIKSMVASPDFSFADFRWLLEMLNVKGFYNKNKELLDYTLLVDVYNTVAQFRVPIYFISGEYDKTCRVDLVKEYYEIIQAPDKKMTVIKSCGHSPQMDAPTAVAKEIKKLLAVK